MTNEIPIYEKLLPDEVLLISRTSHTILYAVNVNGEVQIKESTVQIDDY